MHFGPSTIDFSEHAQELFSALSRAQRSLVYTAKKLLLSREKRGEGRISIENGPEVAGSRVFGFYAFGVEMFYLVRARKILVLHFSIDSGPPKGGSRSCAVRQIVLREGANALVDLIARASIRSGVIPDLATLIPRLFSPSIRLSPSTRSSPSDRLPDSWIGLALALASTCTERLLGQSLFKRAADLRSEGSTVNGLVTALIGA
jgi:hypothetical protein